MTDQNKYQTKCVRYENGVYREYVQSAYYIEYHVLKYIVHCLNGHLNIKLELYNDRDNFIINTIYTLVQELRQQKPIFFNNQTQDQKINFQILLGDHFEPENLSKLFEKFDDNYLGFIEFDFQINKRTVGNQVLK